MTRPMMADPLAEAIRKGIEDVFPVDLLSYMGQKRADQYMALWATSAMKRVRALATTAVQR